MSQSCGERTEEKLHIGGWQDLKDKDDHNPSDGLGHLSSGMQKLPSSKGWQEV